MKNPAERCTNAKRTTEDGAPRIPVIMPVPGERKARDRRTVTDPCEYRDVFELINVPSMLCARVCVRHFL